QAAGTSSPQPAGPAGGRGQIGGACWVQADHSLRGGPLPGGAPAPQGGPEPGHYSPGGRGGSPGAGQRRPGLPTPAERASSIAVLPGTAATAVPWQGRRRSDHSYRGGLPEMLSGMPHSFVFPVIVLAMIVSEPLLLMPPPVRNHTWLPTMELLLTVSAPQLS